MGRWFYPTYRDRTTRCVSIKTSFYLQSNMQTANRRRFPEPPEKFPAPQGDYSDTRLRPRTQDATFKFFSFFTQLSFRPRQAQWSLIKPLPGT
ncbi:hypothetical protein FOZ60_005410 [Perkinsus olseni]|uniref:Uncharacterized protein n=1 Tax=Perkinsus olseni TaxID=32597 RepID=A0A7J6NS22_PEROL|nr:hypothetical protein FOZ60_005410 [Perkinsus olseni]